MENDGVEFLRQQLAAAQARENELRNALEAEKISLEEEGMELLAESYKVLNRPYDASALEEACNKAYSAGFVAGSTNMALERKNARL